MPKHVRNFFSSMFLTWIFGTMAAVLLAWPALKVVIFILKCMLAFVYALSGNAPAGWEAPF